MIVFVLWFFRVLCLMWRRRILLLRLLIRWRLLLRLRLRDVAWVDLGKGVRLSVAVLPSLGDDRLCVCFVGGFVLTLGCG